MSVDGITCEGTIFTLIAFYPFKQVWKWEYAWLQGNLSPELPRFKEVKCQWVQIHCTAHCVSSPQLGCFLKHYLHVLPAIWPILQLLYSPIGNQTFEKEQKWKSRLRGWNTVYTDGFTSDAICRQRRMNTLGLSLNFIEAKKRKVPLHAKSNFKVVNSRRVNFLLVQSSPLIRSTDVRSTRLYGQFLAGPNHRTLILISNPDIRSARLYGQFSLDKTLTLQAGSTVHRNQNSLLTIETNWD